MDHLCYFCPVFVMLSRLFIAGLWSLAGKGLTSWLLFVLFNCVFLTFSCGILGQAWYLIVSIPDLCRLSFFVYQVYGNDKYVHETNLLDCHSTVFVYLSVYLTYLYL